MCDTAQLQLVSGTAGQESPSITTDAHYCSEHTHVCNTVSTYFNFCGV